MMIAAQSQIAGPIIEEENGMSEDLPVDAVALR
jgi:hypothetical protein